jgi:cytoskeleton-associated protein 5
MPGLINKCLNSRQKTRDKAIEIIMMYIEAEKQEIVQEELIKGLDNKQPKIVQACLEILRRSINEFSSKTMPIKPVIKFVPKLLEDRDKIVRDETKLLAIEMYRWAGAAIMPQLQGYKLLDELEAEFKAATAGGEKPRQTRFLRSQQDLKAKMDAEMEQKLMSGGSSAAGNGDGTGAGSGMDAEAAMETIDPYDLMEPSDILSKLPKDFKEKLVINKKCFLKKSFSKYFSLN